MSVLVSRFLHVTRDLRGQLPPRLVRCESHRARRFALNATVDSFAVELGRSSREDKLEHPFPAPKVGAHPGMPPL